LVTTETEAELAVESIGGLTHGEAPLEGVAIGRREGLRRTVGGGHTAGSKEATSGLLDGVAGVLKLGLGRMTSASVVLPARLVVYSYDSSA